MYPCKSKTWRQGCSPQAILKPLKRLWKEDRQKNNRATIFATFVNATLKAFTPIYKYRASTENFNIWDLQTSGSGKMSSGWSGHRTWFFLREKPSWIKQSVRHICATKIRNASELCDRPAQLPKYVFWYLLLEVSIRAFILQDLFQVSKYLLSRPDKIRNFLWTFLLLTYCDAGPSVIRTVCKQ